MVADIPENNLGGVSAARPTPGLFLSVLRLSGKEIARFKAGGKYGLRRHQVTSESTVCVDIKSRPRTTSV